MFRIEALASEESILHLSIVFGNRTVGPHCFRTDSNPDSNPAVYDASQASDQTMGERHACPSIPPPKQKLLWPACELPRSHRKWEQHESHTFPLVWDSSCNPLPFHF